MIFRFVCTIIIVVIVVLRLRLGLRLRLLLLVVAIAVVGVAFRIAWLNAPRWLYTALYLAMGWAAVGWLNQFWAAGGPAVVVLLVLGGPVTLALRALPADARSAGAARPPFDKAGLVVLATTLAAYALAYPLAIKHALVISIALSIVAGVVWQSRAAQQPGARHD